MECGGGLEDVCCFLGCVLRGGGGGGAVKGLARGRLRESVRGKDYEESWRLFVAKVLVKSWRHHLRWNKSARANAAGKSSLYRYRVTLYIAARKIFGTLRLQPK